MKTALPSRRGKTPTAYARLLLQGRSKNEAIAIALSHAGPFWVSVLVAIGDSVQKPVRKRGRNPIITGETIGKVTVRLADEKEWQSSHRIVANETELVRFVRDAWDEYIVATAHDKAAKVHPALALPARRKEIADWEREREERGGTEDQKRSWKSQAAHWRYEAERKLGGPASRLLCLHVQGLGTNVWIRPMGPGGLVHHCVPRVIDLAAAGRLLQACRISREMDEGLARMGGLVTEEIRKAQHPGLTLVPKPPKPRDPNPARRAVDPAILAELRRVDARYAAIVKELDALRDKYGIPHPAEIMAGTKKRVEPPDAYREKRAKLEDERGELFDERWELRKQAGFDPRTGRPKEKEKPMSLPEEGYYPDLLGPTEELRGGCREHLKEHAAAPQILHTSCYGGAFHHFRYELGDETVAGLTLRATAPRRGKQTATIDRVYTDPKHRRRGYAKELLSAARDYFAVVKHSKDLTGDGKAWKRSVTKGAR